MQVGANAEASGPYPEATAGFTACFAWKDQVVWCNGWKRNVMRVVAAERRNGSLEGKGSEG